MGNTSTRIEAQPPFIIALVIISILWMFFWKGVALWRAGEQKQKKWFIVLFISTILYPFLPNDLGILELIYLFRYSKKKMTITEMKQKLSGLKSIFVRS